jgi:hypothetical protein
VSRSGKRRRNAVDFDRTWMKWTKCSICRGKFCVNNYADRRVRINQWKIAGKIVCPWCRGRDGVYLIQLRLIAEKLAARRNADCQVENCKCLSCVAYRVLEAHDSLPVRRR